MVKTFSLKTKKKKEKKKKKKKEAHRQSDRLPSSLGVAVRIAAENIRNIHAQSVYGYIQENVCTRSSGSVLSNEQKNNSDLVLLMIITGLMYNALSDTVRVACMIFSLINLFI